MFPRMKTTSVVSRGGYLPVALDDSQQAYLSRHGLHVWLENLTEDLVTQQPERPWDFIEQRVQFAKSNFFQKFQQSSHSSSSEVGSLAEPRAASGRRLLRSSSLSIFPAKSQCCCQHGPSSVPSTVLSTHSLEAPPSTPPPPSPAALRFQPSSGTIMKRRLARLPSKVPPVDVNGVERVKTGVGDTKPCSAAPPLRRKGGGGGGSSSSHGPTSPSSATSTCALSAATSSLLPQVSSLATLVAVTTTLPTTQLTKFPPTLLPDPRSAHYTRHQFRNLAKDYGPEEEGCPSPPNLLFFAPQHPHPPPAATVATPAPSSRVRRYFKEGPTQSRSAVNPRAQQSSSAKAPGANFTSWVSTLFHSRQKDLQEKRVSKGGSATVAAQARGYPGQLSRVSSTRHSHVKHS